jgi:hypothetical protein
MPDVLRVLDQQADRWRWWDEGNGEVRRPLALMTLLRPEDAMEVGRPERGVAVRIRCWWGTTNQGVPKQERVRLIGLQVDGEKTEAVPVQAKNAQGAIVDRYHLLHLPDLKPGRHTVEATVEQAMGGAQQKLALELMIG